MLKLITFIVSLLLFSVVGSAGLMASAGNFYQAQDTCKPISTLPCTALKVSLPFKLSFSAPVVGTLSDKNKKGTGFRTVNSYSGSRLAVDGQPPVPQVPGYMPSKIYLTGGRLQLVANKGIDYQTNNNQLNVLGVQVNATGKLQLDVKLIKPYKGTSSQQAGIWFGLNDQTYIKLSIIGNQIELRKELNDVSSGLAGNTNPDRRMTGAIYGLETKTVSLRLMIDTIAKTAEGFYATDGKTYTSTGKTGYPQPWLDISPMGLTSGTLYAGIFASYRNGSTSVTYTFDDFGVSDLTPQKKVFTFSRDTLNFTVLKGNAVLPQAVKLTSNPATSVLNLSKSNASWLTLPPYASDSLKFGPLNISSNMTAGNYQALVICSADGYEQATLLINLNVVDKLEQKTINVNFQDAKTQPPLGYVVDNGQPFGERKSKNQSTGLSYGWRKKLDGSPLDLTLNSRLRTMPEDILLATLIHMQANTISGTTFQGVKTEGYWELKVPNGSYDVTVSVGDGTVSAAPEKHTINVEGVNAINLFVPSGKQGDIGRFKSNTITVNVADEILKIDANGGTNTKINFASIVPVSTAPYLYWTSNNQNIIIKKGTNESKSFSMVLGSSNDVASAYTVTATFSGASAPWLVFNPSPTGVQPSVKFDFTSAKDLPLGVYYATIKATSPTYTSAEFAVQLSVIDSLRPYVVSATPANSSTNVSVGTVIAANNLRVPVVPGYPGGVDTSTVKDNSVMLYKVDEAALTRVDGTVQSTGGGDVISFSPASALLPETKYKYVITSDVKSNSGLAFMPFESIFTTENAIIDSSSFLNAQFKKIPIPGTQNIKYSSLTIGPDDKLYALRLDGIIERFDINHTDGALSNQKQIKTLYNKYGERSAIGMAFDPRSIPGNMILWLSHSSRGLEASPTFDGNISRLDGDSLQNESLIITKLPRSTKDHMVNGLAFGPDSALYISQGSNSSAGDIDNEWQRDESLLAGTILRLDLNKLKTFVTPLNVQTTPTKSVINNAPAVAAVMSDGTYNPYGSNSPLTIYASGVRNAYDLVWHSNGQLYVPTNGSGGGGNSPASVAGTRRPDGTFYSGPVIRATKSVAVQNDWLFRINPALPVGYFGHPNPLRGEYVINRGYPDNALYSQIVEPDVRYRPAAYNFGLNHSPNGVLEYKSNNFKGALKGKLLVCRFSGGGDIIVMEPGSIVKTAAADTNDHIYDIVKVTTGSGNNGLVGMSGFGNPLDIVEDTFNGNLYVIEYNWNDNTNLTRQITLLKAQDKPIVPVAMLAVAASPESTASSAPSNNYWVTIMNKGEGVLKVKNINLSGAGASKFKISSVPLPSATQPLVIPKYSSLSFKLNALSPSSKKAIANLKITSMEDTVKEVLVSTILPEDTLVNTNKGESEVKVEATVKPERSLVVYPNPNTGGPLNIRLKNFFKYEPVDLVLYNRNGRILKSYKALTDSNGEYTSTITIDKKDQLADFYIVRALFSAGSKSVNVMVTR